MKKIIFGLLILSFILVGCKDEKIVYNPMEHICTEGFNITLSKANLIGYTADGITKECFSSFVNLSDNYKYMNICCNKGKYIEMNETTKYNRDDLISPIINTIMVEAVNEINSAYYYGYNIGYQEGKNEK